MVETSPIIGTIKSWSEKAQRYEPVRSIDFSKNPTFEFGNIEITAGFGPFFVDPSDTGPSITLKKKEGVQPDNLHIFELRTLYKEPKRYVVGETIMKEKPFSFSKLGEVMSIQIFKGDPQNGQHPEMLEIVPANRIGESTSSPLL
jgi:hypothetical protein